MARTRRLRARAPTYGAPATRNLRRALGEGAEVPLGRMVVLLLFAIAAVAFFVASNLAKAGPSEQVKDLGAIDARALLGGDTSSDHFLPTPVAVLPAETDAGPPAAASDEPAAAAAQTERVKVVNTGGLGVLLRADPPRGRFLQSLRDGQELEVIEHRTVDGDDWLHVRTQQGVEGWVFGRLVGPD
jgi:Bacterial SH3 domain